MTHPYRRAPWWVVAALVGCLASETSRADVLGAVQTLREGGCGGLVPAVPALRQDSRLDRVAQQWALGESLAAAAARAGLPGSATRGVHVTAADSALLSLLRRSECGPLTDPGLRWIGSYTRGSAIWIVLSGGSAAAVSAQVAASAPGRGTSVRALQLINAARARGAWCGKRQFAPVPPVSLSGTLADVALGHAADMAAHGYFEHEDRSGHSPADRVRAAGYQEQLVGENIAYGPGTVEEVVQGWLDSPGHCENIMDARFAEMGIANTPGRTARHGLYWVQLLAAPRRTG